MLTALVLGGASSVWADAADALDLFTPDIVVAVNDIGARWAGPLSAWATLHPEKFASWQNERRRRGFSDDYLAVTHEKPAGREVGTTYPRIDAAIDYRWPGMTGSGSSGLFGLKVALDVFHAERAVLAGVPMTVETAHFFNGRPWAERDGFISAWHLAMPHIEGRAASVSGWTKEMLGAPTPSWLAGDPRP